MNFDGLRVGGCALFFKKLPISRIWGYPVPNSRARGHSWHGQTAVPRICYPIKHVRWHSHSDPLFLRNFGGLVLGCIDTSDTENRRIFSGFSRPTRFAFLCTAPKSETLRKFRQQFTKIAAFSQNFNQNQSFSHRFSWNFIRISQNFQRISANFWN